MGGTPYDGLPGTAFWRTGVAGRAPGRLGPVVSPRFRLTHDTPVMTAGSCFAQHVHHALRDAGYAVIDTEPAPPGVDPAVALRFQYGTFSARYGNIYAPRQFRQLVAEVVGQHRPAHPVWTREGRFFDALRPSVEPEGFQNEPAVHRARSAHLAAVKDAITRAKVMILTLGLTECWQDTTSGTVYPTAPGVMAEPPPGADIGFLNLGHDAVVADLRDALANLRSLSPGLRLILTVSPVPLTATASGGHVLVASSASKAILRAAADTICASDPGTDYFPAYEIVTNPAARGRFFHANLRTPTDRAVRVVMAQFLAAHGFAPVTQAAAPPAAPHTRGHARDRRADPDEDDTDDENAAFCDEMFNDPGLRPA